MKILKSGKTEKQKRDEMLSPVKTAADSLAEALKRIVRKDATPRQVSVEEILKEDNKVRKEYGLRELLAYPIFLDEYRPTTRQSFYKKLVGAEVFKEKDRLPDIKALYHEAEGFDPADNLEAIDEEVDRRCKELYPTALEITAEMRNAARLSVIQQQEVKMAGESLKPAPEPEVDVDEIEEDNKGTAAVNKKAKK